MRVNGTLYYTLKDHLGSASVVTDSTGNIVGEQRYYPFGETRFSAGTLYTDKLFTRWIEPVEIGQRNITGLGIYHYQSRFYSPKLGRFLSADTIVPNPFNPQDFNRFAYVRNNPVRYTDPSGHMVWDGGNEGGGCYAPNCGLPTLPPPCTRNCGGGGGGNKPDKPRGNDGGGPLGGASGGTGGEPTPPITGANLGGSQPVPSLDPATESCPSWSVCFNDASDDAMSDFWNDNNDIMAFWEGVPLIGTASGIGSAIASRLLARQIISANSIALIASYFGLGALDPLPIEEAIAGIGLGLAVASIGIYFYTSDLQKVNDAIAQTGALTNGGSIVANWDGAVVSGPNGTTTVNTTIPFVVPASLALWGILNTDVSTSP